MHLSRSRKYKLKMVVSLTRILQVHWRSNYGKPPKSWSLKKRLSRPKKRQLTKVVSQTHILLVVLLFSSGKRLKSWSQRKLIRWLKKKLKLRQTSHQNHRLFLSRVIRLLSKKPLTQLRRKLMSENLFPYKSNPSHLPLSLKWYLIQHLSLRKYLPI